MFGAGSFLWFILWLSFSLALLWLFSLWYAFVSTVLFLHWSFKKAYIFFAILMRMEFNSFKYKPAQAIIFNRKWFGSKVIVGVVLFVSTWSNDKKGRQGAWGRHWNHPQGNVGDWKGCVPEREARREPTAGTQPRRSRRDRSAPPHHQCRASRRTMIPLVASRPIVHKFLAWSQLIFSKSKWLITIIIKANCRITNCMV